jgi:hypothetical protein
VLGDLAWQALSPQRDPKHDRNHVTDSEMQATWDKHTQESVGPFRDIVRSTGLLLEAEDHWEFWSDLIRNELAAEHAMTHGLDLCEWAFYPLYERTLGFWAAKSLRAGNAGRVIELLRALLTGEGDPYSARCAARDHRDGDTRLAGDLLPGEHRQ